MKSGSVYELAALSDQRRCESIFRKSEQKQAEHAAPGKDQSKEAEML